MKIYDIGQIKILKSPGYNYVFSKDTGKFKRWGKSKSDNPQFSPFGPEIADIELSTICNGINNKPCSHCYKSNTGHGENMSLDTYKKIFYNLPRTVTQVAFGIGDIDANPDLFSIMEFTRDNGVIPNITINGDRLTSDHVDKLIDICGSIAVSRYDKKRVCYNAVEALTAKGHRQINIHKLVSEETYSDCYEVLVDSLTYPELTKLNAIVFLALKPKGNRNKLTPLKDKNKWKELIECALDNGINIGFDSCSAPWVLEVLKDHPDYTKFEELVEPCESFLFSIYINVKGEVFPCSFLEDTDHFNGNVVENKLIKIWNSVQATRFKKDLLGTCIGNVCRRCPVFDIY